MRAALLACIALAGCADPITEVVVVTDSDLRVPEELDEIRWEVDATAVSGQVDIRSVRLTDGVSLPVRLPIVHRAGSFEPVAVTAEGLVRGETVMRRSVPFTFVRGRSIVVQLDLMSGAPRDAGMLDPDAGVPMSVDAGPMATPDAGPTCPATCTCEQTCIDGACECLAGCGCDLTCIGDDVECNDSKCDGPGTTCTVTADGAEDFKAKCEHQAACTMDLAGISNMTVQCRSESSCDIACTDVSNCEVECSGGASCILECTRTSNCIFTTCNGTETVCPDGRLACNRPCP